MTDKTKLRAQAESQFARLPESLAPLSPEEVQKALHELRVHQIELEMQNEELRQAQADLDASRARYFDLYDLAPVGYCTISEKGLILEANLAASTLLGVVRSALTQQPFTRFIHKEDQDIYYRHRKQLFETGAPQTCEFRMQRPDAALFWVHLVANAAQAADGAPTCRIVMTDFTARKQAENELWASEERYRSILNAAPDGIVIIAAEGRTAMVSPVAAKMFGFSPEEDLRGRPIDDFIVPEDQERAFSNMALLFQGRLNGPIEYRARRVDGSTFDMEVNAETIPGPDGNSRQMVAAVRDITGRKQRESYRELGREILQILNEPGSVTESIQHVIEVLKMRTGIDAVGIRLQDGDDFPYSAQQGFSADFLQTENTLVERTSEGGVCRDKDGNVSLECTCGLVISGKTNPAHPLFTKGGSFWTNNSFPLLVLPADQDPRHHPRNQCIHQGYASMALIPIRTENRIVGLIHLNDHRKGCFTPDAIAILESIAAQIGTALLRKQAEEKLRESEARLSAAQEMAHAGHWEYDIASDTFTFNDNFYRIFRTTAEKVGGYQLSSAEYARRFCHPDDSALVGREIQASNKSTDPNYSRQIEHRILYADGTVGHIAVLFSIVKDSQGHTIKTRGVNQDITAYKQAEETLRASQQITESIINTIPMRVFWKDENLVFRGCNQAFARDAGFLDPKDLVGKNDSQMSWRAQAERYRADDRQVIQSGKSKLFIEEPQTTPDGKTITLLTSKTPLRNAQGEITGVLGTYLDITERKQTEEKLRATELRLREIASNIPGVIYQLMVNRKGFFEVPFMSAGYENLFERHLEGMDYAALWFDHMLADDQVLFRQSLAAAAKRMEQWTMEFRIATPDGRTKWVRGSANPQPLPTGGILWNGVLLDVTELKRAEDQLRESEAFQSLLLETIPAPVFYKDRQGRYQGFNKAFEAFFGKTKDQLVGKSIFDINPPELAKVYHAEDANLFEHPGIQIYESQVKTSGGVTHDVVFHKASTTDAQGRITGLIGIILDITERKQAEEQMAKQLDELRRWQTVTLGREDRIGKLKREVNALTTRLGQPPPYTSVEEQ